MEYLTLGKTELMVSRTAFELHELQEKNEIEDYSVLLQAAYENGINFFATNARYEYSLETLGTTFSKLRSDIKYCIYSDAINGFELSKDIEFAIEKLGCDSIEILCLCAEKFPTIGTADGLYDEFLQSKKNGIIKHIALKTSSFNRAREAIISGLYEIIAYNFSAASSEADDSIVQLCENMDIGFLAVNPAGDNELTNIPLSIGFLNQFENVVPLWKLLTKEKLQQILYFISHPPVMDEKLKSELDAFRT
jgi:aryl-alcohol dehydrogenase-like predicted oxidoreductase